VKYATVIGILIWVVVFLVWYIRTYPEKIPIKLPKFKFQWPRKKKIRVPGRSAPASNDFRDLVDTVESICALDRFSASDAATMVDAVKRIVEIETSSGQIWEAYALDSLETAEIICDTCKISVQKTIKKTGVKIICPKCQKWLALRNSKVMIFDPSRADLEDWEK
jgi:hypothetical protein